jgi:hypothetical protein
MRRALPLALLVLLLGAASAQASTYAVAGTDLTITPGFGKLITLRAEADGTYTITANDAWTGSGANVGVSGGTLTPAAAITAIAVQGGEADTGVTITGTG